MAQDRTPERTQEQAQKRSVDSTEEPTPQGSTQPAEQRAREPRSDSPAPGNNRLSDIPDEDIDKVVPRDSKETQLKDRTRENSVEGEEPDETGQLPRPL